jgi:hypothetical protein
MNRKLINMKKQNIIQSLVILVLSFTFYSCEKTEEVAAKYGPENIREVTIKYTPDAGTSSVSFFQTTYKNDYSCRGYNNEASYPGVVWNYDGGTTITLSYPDGGREIITFVGETRYKYKGTTASGYSESHTGNWQLVNVNTDDGDTGSSNPQIVFWVGKDFGCGNIKVTFNGTTKYISQYYSSTPEYGASGCASFTVNPGTYSWKAECGNWTWSGTESLQAYDLITYKLTD